MARCTGHSSRTGQPCKAFAVHGATVCISHGAAAPQVRAKAMVRTYGLPRDITPAAALLEEVRYAAGHVAWLRGKVAELDPGSLTWGISEIAHKQATEFGGTDTTERAALNVWLEAYHRERRYLLDVSRAALAAGVEERLVQLAEAQGLAMVTILARVFERVGLTDAQKQLAAVVVPEELRAQSVP
jgi:DNA-binding TFAR19-related protein (PDSD5 family)